MSEEAISKLIKQEEEKMASKLASKIPQVIIDVNTSENPECSPPQPLFSGLQKVDADLIRHDGNF